MKSLETGNGVRILKSGGLECRQATREEIPVIDLQPMFSAFLPAAIRAFDGTQP